MKKLTLVALFCVSVIFGVKKVFFTMDTVDTSLSSKQTSWTSAQISSTKDDGNGASKVKKLGNDTVNGKKNDKKKTSKSKSNAIPNPFEKKVTDNEVITREEAQAFAFREIDFTPMNEEEGSLLEMGRQMAANYLVPDSYKDVIKFYEEKGLKPIVSKDTNPYTGTMIIVRTEKSLPGTRYPHLQSFTNERGEADTQHYSIEYRPGPKAFERTNEMVKALYNVENGVKSANGDFIKYKLGPDQNIWIKKLGPNDIKGSPFNAREESDVGTIRMVIEEEIHNDNHEDHFEAPSTPKK
jgi:hypothetical protein